GSRRSRARAAGQRGRSRAAARAVSGDARPTAGMTAPNLGVATAKPSLAAFLRPSAVAVIGASRDPSKVGGSVLANLRASGFAGRVVPVNPRADRVQGLAAVS